MAIVHRDGVVSPARRPASSCRLVGDTRTFDPVGTAVHLL